MFFLTFMLLAIGAVIAIFQLIGIILLAIEIAKILCSLFLATLRLLKVFTNWLVSAVSTLAQDLSSFLFNAITLLMQPFVAQTNDFSNPTVHAAPVTPLEPISEPSVSPYNPNINFENVFLPMYGKPFYAESTPYNNRFFPEETPVLAEIMDESQIEIYENMLR